ncbi:unnamed protein product [Musa textilis]
MTGGEVKGEEEEDENDSRIDANIERCHFALHRHASALELMQIHSGTHPSSLLPRSLVLLHFTTLYLC